MEAGKARAHAEALWTLLPYEGEFRAVRMSVLVNEEGDTLDPNLGKEAAPWDSIRVALLAAEPVARVLLRVDKVRAFLGGGALYELPTESIYI